MRIRLVVPTCLTMAIVLGASSSVRAQNVELRGRVVDETGGTPVADALVRMPDLERYTFANREGWFRFDGIPAGRHRVEIQHLGYAASEQWIVADGATDVTLRVAPQPIVLDALIAHSGFLDQRAKRWRLGSGSGTPSPPFFTWNRSDILKSGISDPTLFLKKVSKVRMEQCAMLEIRMTCVVRPFYQMSPGIRTTIAGRVYSAARGGGALSVGMFRRTATQRLCPGPGYCRPPLRIAPHTRVAVYVDDQVVPGGLDALDSLHAMRNMWRVETYGHRAEMGIRFYTLDYMQRVATGEIHPLEIPATDVFDPLPSWVTPPRRRR